MRLDQQTPRVLILLVLLCLAHSLSSGQTRKSATPAEEAGSEIIHWTSVLDRLAIDAKILRDETERPEAIIAVADAFWSVNNKKSRELFVEALNLAVAIESTNVRSVCVRRVIVAAGTRDGELAKELVDKLQTNEKQRTGTQPLAAAIDLLNVNPQAAEAIALANARNGPSFETAELIFGLHKQDPVAAARVYSAYLVNLRREDPSQLLWLAGYPFGFHEALGGSINPAKLYGVFGLSKEGLSPNSPLAAALLARAAVTVDRLLDEAQSRPPEQAETYKALAFFTLTYLSPQIERYRPDLTARWFALQQSVGSLLDQGRREEIIRQVASIAASRLKTNDRDNTDANDDFSQIEKLPGTCQRDEAYAHTAFRSSYKSDFKKALSVADKVHDLDLRADVMQFIYFDLALFAISPKSSGGVDEGLMYAERVSKPEQRSYLYLKLAEFVARSDGDRARLILNDAVKTSEQIEDFNFRAAILFVAAYNLSTLDATLLESFSVLEKAIRLLKDGKELRIDKISLARRINFNCDSANPHWYGGFDDLGGINLMATLVRISARDSRMAEELATALPPGLNRIRSLAVLANERIKSASLSEKSRSGVTRVN